MIAPDDPTPAREREQRRRDHAYRARMWRWILALDLGFWLIVLTITFPPAPRLVWNASASAPVGLYWVSPGAQLARGDTVIAWMPGAYRRLAAERRYLPENVPLVKHVAGMSGDRVCARGASIAINGRNIATRLRTDGAGQPMPWWQGCRTLEEGQFFLLMVDASGSFDGRYFGITESADIVGKARLIWAR